MTQKKTPKIQVRGLKKSFGDIVVLNGIDLDLYEKESLVIIGGSGTGKSVLIKCIMGLLHPDEGSIKIDGKETINLSGAERDDVFRQFGMLFQGAALFDSMNVWRNVAFSLIQGQGMDRIKAKAIAFEKLKAVDLTKAEGYKFPAELSGGMRKRVALARAIAADQKVIFFDEPTTGLDPIVSGTINQLIINCVRKIGASAITITHDINSLRAIADRVGLLYEGRLIWMGTTKEMDKTKDPYVVQFIHGHPNGPFSNKF